MATVEETGWALMIRAIISPCQLNGAENTEKGKMCQLILPILDSYHLGSYNFDKAQGLGHFEGNYGRRKNTRTG